MNNLHALFIFLVAALVTVAIRFLPFLVFGHGRKTPAFITALAKTLPMAVMAMLIVYCLKDVTFQTVSGFLPALIGVSVTVGLHILKRQTLLSILGGTVVYMVLVNLVFI